MEEFIVPEFVDYDEVDEYEHEFYEYGKIVKERRHFDEVEWRIQDFVPFREDVPFRNSPAFNFSDELWYLSIVKNDGWLSMRLNRKDSQLEISVSFTLGLKEADGTLHKSKSATHFFTPSTSKFSWSNVMKTEELLLQRSKLCPNGTITVYCELRLNEECQADAESQTPRHCDNVTLSRNLSNLYVKHKLCDVTIIVGDRKFQAHRSVLAARSTVFASMFEHDTKEKKSGVIEIEDCDPDVFHKFLYYVYTSEMNIMSTKEAIALYFIADKYDLPQLTSLCEEFLVDHLCVQSFCDVLVLATKFNNSTLIKAAEDFFVEHTEDVLVTAEWQNFMIENSFAANELFIKCAQTFKI